MATAKTKMTEEVTAADFYVVRTFRKMADNWNTTLNDCNEKFVKKGVEKGKELVDEFRKNTEEAFDGMLNDSKKVMAMIPMLESITPKVEEDKTEFYLAQAIKKARESATTTIRGYSQVTITALNQYKDTTVSAVKNYRETGNAIYKDTNENLRKALANGRGVASGVAKGAREAVNGLAEDSKKLVAQAGTTLTTTQGAVSARIESVMDAGFAKLTEKLDLPTKKDIKKLTKLMEEFNKKIDTLQKA
ncbi:MAG: phasin family protein [Proteobacteria bacterium]|nr:phasin family protein [Pseudomonadota bacterium]